MSVELFALLTVQGTATPETCLCFACLDVEDTRFAAIAAAGEDVNVDRGFVVVTSNELMRCIGCGAVDRTDWDLAWDAYHAGTITDAELQARLHAYNVAQNAAQVL